MALKESFPSPYKLVGYNLKSKAPDLIPFNVAIPAWTSVPLFVKEVTDSPVSPPTSIVIVEFDDV
jgi:hypothetical protein